MASKTKHTEVTRSFDAQALDNILDYADELKRLLNEYGGHTFSCEAYISAETHFQEYGECTCGWEAVYDAIKD